MSTIIGQPLDPADDGVMDDFDLAESGASDLSTVVQELIQISPDQHGLRLDKVLALRLKGWSRSHLADVISRGDVQHIRHPERPAVSLTPPTLKPSHKVKSGETYQVTLRPLASSAAFEAQDIALAVVHEDAHLLVVHKPAGLVVHPAPGHWSGTLLNAVLHHHPEARDLPRAGIVHRLDKDTSGLMVVAKSRPAMDALVQAIAARLVKREYLALAHGHWASARTTIVQTDIGRDPRNRLRMAVLPGGKGKWSQTDFTCLSTNDQASWLHCQLHTGRTHQIRVHLQHLKHPLVGDPTYGGREVPGLNRQALHAWRLSLIHPMNHQALSWTCPPPPDWVAGLEQMGLGYNENLLPVP